MSPAHWEVTEVDDISVLNTLQTVVSACGQVQICDPGMSAAYGQSETDSGPISVGTVLLAMRYGKRGMSRLDNLSQLQGRTFRSGEVATGGLGAGCVRVVRGAMPRPPLGHTTWDTPRDAPSWEGWIDTEVELT